MEAPTIYNNQQGSIVISDEKTERTINYGSQQDTIVTYKITEEYNNGVFVTVSRDGNAKFVKFGIRASDGKVIIQAYDAGYQGLPTSASGLGAGTIYSDNGTLKIKTS
jgi:hypothetical protein